MAKKKRKRRPIAPPIHSAPGAARYEPPATDGDGAAVADAAGTGTVAPETRPARPRPARPRPAGRKPMAGRRRSRTRTYLIIGGVILLIVAAFVGRQILNSRATREFDRLAQANGCGKLDVTGSSGASAHLAEGERTTYDTSPPTHGEHSGTGRVPAGVYEEAFSEDPTGSPTIYEAVHSLEHGYIIVWHDGLDEGDQQELASEYRGERKVIVVPYPKLEGDTKVALTAWGRVVECEAPSQEVIAEFIDLFREARTAPEPTQS